VNAVAAGVGICVEKASQALGRKIGGDAAGVDPRAGRGNGVAIDIGGKDLQGIALL